MLPTSNECFDIRPSPLDFDQSFNLQSTIPNQPFRRHGLPLPTERSPSPSNLPMLPCRRVRSLIKPCLRRSSPPRLSSTPPPLDLLPKPSSLAGRFFHPVSRGDYKSTPHPGRPTASRAKPPRPPRAAALPTSLFVPAAAALLLLLMAQLVVGDPSPLPAAQEQLAQLSMNEKPAATAAVAEPELPSPTTAALPPGRPGTLTPEEEEKLRQLWALSARLFGFADEDEPAPAPPGTPPNGGPPPASPLSPSTPSRSRRAMVSGWFRRRDDSAASSDAESAATPPTSDGTAAAPTSGGWNAAALAAVLDRGDDKHGLAAQFRAALAQTTPQELRDAFWDMVKHDHPDGILLRFLRARKWDVPAAQVMAISALHWRAAGSRVDSDIMLRGEMGMLDDADAEEEKERQFGMDFMEQIRLGKSFLRGVDRQGRPCCYIRVRLHHAGDQSEASLERFTVYVIETARLMLKPPIDTAVRLNSIVTMLIGGRLLYST